MQSAEPRDPNPPTSQPPPRSSGAPGAAAPRASDVLIAMLDHTQAQVAYLDTAFNFVEVNAAYVQGCGHTRAELVGRNHFDLFPNDENLALFRQVRDSGQAITYAAKPFVFADRPELGVTYWNWVLKPVVADDGCVVGLLLSLLDVTARQRSEDALAESEARYRLLAESMADGLASLDVHGRISYVNDEFCRMLGYPREELLGRQHLDVVPPALQPRHQQELVARLSGTEHKYETELVRKDGTRLAVLQSGRPLRDASGAVVGTLAVFADVSELKHAQRALSAEHAFISAVLDTVGALVVVLDLEARIVRFNRACELLTGYESDAMLGRRFWDLLIRADELEQVKQVWYGLVSGQWVNRFENYWVTRSGAERLISWSNTALTDDQGTVQHVIATGIDVTETRRAEQRIADLARFPGENVNPVMRVGADGTLLYANEASADILQAWGARVGQQLPTLWSAHVADALARHSRHQERLACGERTYALDVAPILPGDYANIYGVDITLQVRSQEALERSRDELEQRVRERTRDLEVLSEAERHQRQTAEGLLRATQALNSSLELDTVLDHILEQAQQVLPCQAVALIPSHSGDEHYARHRGLGALHRDAVLLACLRGDADPQLAPATDPVVSIPDVTKTCRMRRYPELAWVRSIIAAPMWSEGRRVGYLAAFSGEPGHFGEQVAHLLEGFAAHAVIASRNAALFDAERRARHLAESLAEGSRALSQTLEPASTMNTLLDQLQLLVPHDGASVALLQDEDTLAVRAVRGEQWPDDALGRAYAVSAVPQIAQVITGPRSVLIGDATAVSGWRHPLGVTNIRSWAAVPMVVGGRAVGMVELYRTGAQPLDEETLQAATALIDQGAAAVQNAWLFEQVRAGRQRLQAMSRQLVEAQETERYFIARELHDEVAQGLASIQVGLSLVARDAHDPARVQAGIDELRNMSDGVFDNLHGLAQRLRPASLEHVGLIAVVRQHVEELRQRYGQAVDLEVVGCEQRLPRDLEAALYRIIQEALNNAIRHAQATRIAVLLQQTPESLIALVEDNGVGMEPERVAQSERLGLYGMRERAEMLGGTLTIESAPGQGTTIQVEVPYADPHRAG